MRVRLGTDESQPLVAGAEEPGYEQAPRLAISRALTDQGGRMDIEVHLFATLRAGRFRQRKLVFPVGSTVADVCRHLAIDPHEAAILMVNGVATHRDHPLQAGDAVSIFPPLSGG